MADTFSRKKTILFYIKRIFGLVLLLTLAAVFLFSGYSKLMSIESFEWTFLDMGIGNMTTASVIARVFIGLEFLIGLFLLLHVYLKQVTYPLTIFMLLALTVYLVLLIIQQGNTGNCGCFGDWIYMKPLEAIWKNIAMIAATVLLIFIYPIKPYRHQEWISVVIGMIAMVAPFIFMPLNIGNQPQAMQEPIDLNALYQSGEKQPYVDLRKGKHIIAFMSLTCPHCKKAAYLLQIIKRQHPEMPVYLILRGHPDQEKDFFDETRAKSVPHLLFSNSEAFRQMAGEYVPAIYWVNNSVIERKSNYFQLDPKYMEKWLKE